MKKKNFINEQFRDHVQNIGFALVLSKRMCQLLVMMFTNPKDIYTQSGGWFISTVRSLQDRGLVQYIEHKKDQVGYIILDKENPHRLTNEGKIIAQLLVSIGVKP